MRFFFILFSIVLTLAVTGCATVPLESSEKNNIAKTFPKPDKGKASLYIYRSNTPFGAALKKDIHLNDECIGETASGTFFYKNIQANKPIVLTTESEFSPNKLIINNVKSGKIYFVEQIMKMGVFVGGAKLVEVPEYIAKKTILNENMSLAIEGICNE